MKFNVYQKEVERTAPSKGDPSRIINCIFGLVGETGEVVDYLKKVGFQGHELDTEKVKEELGDVLWYLTALASTFDLSLADIAELVLRYPRGFDPERSKRR